MTVHRGIDGAVEVGGTPTALLELVGWEYERTDTIIETRSMGSPASKPLGGNHETTGTFTVHKDYADAGQLLLVPGTKVATILYPGGKGSGLPQLAADVVISGEGASAELDDLVGGTFPFHVEGAFVPTTQT